MHFLKYIGTILMVLHVTTGLSAGIASENCLNTFVETEASHYPTREYNFTRGKIYQLILQPDNTFESLRFVQWAEPQKMGIWSSLTNPMSIRYIEASSISLSEHNPSRNWGDFFSNARHLFKTIRGTLRTHLRKKELTSIFSILDRSTHTRIAAKLDVTVWNSFIDRLLRLDSKLGLYIESMGFRIPESLLVVLRNTSSNSHLRASSTFGQVEPGLKVIDELFHNVIDLNLNPNDTVDLETFGRSYSREFSKFILAESYLEISRIDFAREGFALFFEYDFRHKNPNPHDVYHLESMHDLDALTSWNQELLKAGLLRFRNTGKINIHEVLVAALLWKIQTSLGSELFERKLPLILQELSKSLALSWQNDQSETQKSIVFLRILSAVTLQIFTKDPNHLLEPSEQNQLREAIVEFLGAQGLSL